MSDFIIKKIPGSYDFTVEPIAASRPARSSVEVPMNDYFKEQLDLIPAAPRATPAPPQAPAKPVSDTVRAIQSSFRDSFLPMHTTTGRFKL